MKIQKKAKLLIPGILSLFMVGCSLYVTEKLDQTGSSGSNGEKTVQISVSIPSIDEGFSLTSVDTAEFMVKCDNNIEFQSGMSSFLLPMGAANCLVQLSSFAFSSRGRFEPLIPFVTWNPPETAKYQNAAGDVMEVQVIHQLPSILVNDAEVTYEVTELMRTTDIIVKTGNMTMSTISASVEGDTPPAFTLSSVRYAPGVLEFLVACDKKIVGSTLDAASCMDNKIAELSVGMDDATNQTLDESYIRTLFNSPTVATVGTTGFLVPSDSMDMTNGGFRIQLPVNAQSQDGSDLAATYVFAMKSTNGASITWAKVYTSESPTPNPPPPPPPVPNDGELKAFPGAEGFGADSVGGRGGKVMFIDNLSDSGSGSLRSCVESSGPRTCVFRTGGTIVLKDTLEITSPFLTIAGQTAPGDGIMIRKDGGDFQAMKIEASDVVIRFVRIRPGPGGGKDAINVSEKVEDIVIDHVSATWATDETISVSGASLDNAPSKVSIQWNIISEALNNSTHPEGRHGYGTLLKRTKDISVHHNLYAHLQARAPQMSPADKGIIDIVNNVVYNTASQGSWGSSHIKATNGTPRVNYVNNFVKKGADTNHDFYVSTSGEVDIFESGNVVPGNRTLDSGLNSVAAKQPAPDVTTWKASMAYDMVLQDVGASRGLDCDGSWSPKRDSVDARIINDVNTKSGRIIDTVAQGGGWPEMKKGTPCADTDKDGMPDAWENLHGFDRNNGSDNNEDADGDGYTNFEEFLNGTSPR